MASGDVSLGPLDSSSLNGQRQRWLLFFQIRKETETASLVVKMYAISGQVYGY